MVGPVPCGAWDKVKWDLKDLTYKKPWGCWFWHWAQMCHETLLICAPMSSGPFRCSGIFLETTKTNCSEQSGGAVQVTFSFVPWDIEAKITKESENLRMHGELLVSKVQTRLSSKPYLKPQRWLKFWRGHRILDFTGLNGLFDSTVFTKLQFNL